MLLRSASEELCCCGLRARYTLFSRQELIDSDMMLTAMVRIMQKVNGVIEGGGRGSKQRASFIHIPTSFLGSSARVLRILNGA